MTHPQIALWASAADAFDQRHRLIEAQHLALATPCDKFDVAALVDHAVGTQIGFAPIFGGSTLEDAAWAEARANMAEALTHEGCLDGTFEHPGLGTLPRETLLAIATNDLLIHSWDLARSIGADESLPQASVEAAIDGIRSFPEGPRQVLFNDPIELTDEPSRQDQLLAASGRMP